jgi:hypothetical protein
MGRGAPSFIPASAIVENPPLQMLTISDLGECNRAAVSDENNRKRGPPLTGVKELPNTKSGNPRKAGASIPTTPTTLTTEAEG